MKIDPLHYVDWVVWAGTTYAALPSPVDRDRFTHELLTVFQTLTNLFSDLPKGSGFGLLLALRAWATRHPDPLAPCRSAMEGMNKRWLQAPGSRLQAE